jgi:hypothetical protein
VTKVRGCGGASEGAVVRGCAKHTVEPSILAGRHLPAIVCSPIPWAARWLGRRTMRVCDGDEGARVRRCVRRCGGARVRQTHSRTVDLGRATSAGDRARRFHGPRGGCGGGTMRVCDGDEGARVRACVRRCGGATVPPKVRRCDVPTRSNHRTHRTIGRTLAPSHGSHRRTSSSRLY